MKTLFTTLAAFASLFLFAQQTPPASDLEVVTPNPVRVFVLAGQSNMQGQGKIYNGANGAVGIVMDSFTPMCEGGAATCEFTFNMIDGYGDGWNGWTYDFVQDGQVMASETLPNGEEGTVTVTLEDGVECEIVVNSAGAYGPEISWTVTDADENVLASIDTQPEDYPSPNTLLDVMENDEEGLWSVLQDDGEWTVTDNAYLHYENGQGTLIKDQVTIGQGVNPERIGPELMFGHVMDEYLDDPVLIIKTAWGGLSLGEDFRPPSAGGTVGPYYTDMIEIVENVTENLATEFPDLGISEFEISGFAWFQGWNDAGSEDFLNEYESNLHHLVNDVRNDFGNPELPIVIASAGQGGYEDHWGWTQDIQEIVAVAQENVACDDIQYGGTVGFVNTKELYMAAEESPDDAGFHYHNNALTFLNVGKSIGEEMILALNNMSYCEGFVSVQTLTVKDCGLSVYPNPASHQLTVDLGDWNGSDVVVRMFDVDGKVVLHESTQSRLVMDISDLAQGLYVLEVMVNGEVERKRVIVE